MAGNQRRSVAANFSDTLAVLSSGHECMPDRRNSTVGPSIDTLNLFGISKMFTKDGSPSITPCFSWDERREWCLVLNSLHFPRFVWWHISIQFRKLLDVPLLDYGFSALLHRQASLPNLVTSLLKWLIGHSNLHHSWCSLYFSHILVLSMIYLLD